MSVPPIRVTVESEGLTLSQIVWRKFRAPRPGLVERILALNPGLATPGPMLPPGTEFLMPIDGEAAAPEAPAIISLWD